MKTRTKKTTPSAEEIADLAEQGKDVSRYFHKGKMMAPLPKERTDIQRVNVDFTLEILDELDNEARRLNISRQAVIKTLISTALDQRVRLRKKKKAS